MAMLLTLSRFILIIPFCACFYLQTHWPAPWATQLAMPLAFWIFVIASLTDFLDGWVARARNEVSALGAALDPLADKLLLAAALIFLIDVNVINGWMVFGAVIILCRELLVTGLREAVSLTGGTLPVTKLAKWKTTLQLIAISALLLSAPGGLWETIPSPLTRGLYGACVAITFITGADYANKAIRYLRGVS